jgi:hypothetical protein
MRPSAAAQLVPGPSERLVAFAIVRSAASIAWKRSSVLMTADD